MLRYFCGVIVRLLWLPFHCLAYVIGIKKPIYNYNYYSKNDFDLVMNAAVDDGIRPTYETYIQQAKETIEKYIKYDIECIVFHVNARHMLDWFSKNGIKNIHRNRIKYACYQLDLARRNGVSIMKKPLPVISVSLTDKELKQSR